MTTETEEDIKIVETAPADGGEVLTETGEAAPVVTDARVAAPVEKDEDDGEDDSAATEELRAQRRKERKERKERQERARERDKKELEFLRHRNEALEKQFSTLEGRVVRNETISIDERISQVEGQLKTADDVIASAISSANGKDAAEAQNIRDQLRDNLQKLKGHRETLTKPVAQPQRQVAAPNPDVVLHAREWVSKNAWFDASLRDQDSVIADTIDKRLAAEGSNPASEEHWRELDSRLKKYLPHRYAAAAAPAETTTTQQRGPAMANGGRQSAALKPGEVYISPERKDAMKELGVWDDPVLRKKYLKRYMDYDREAASRS